MKTKPIVLLLSLPLLAGAFAQNDPAVAADPFVKGKPDEKVEAPAFHTNQVGVLVEFIQLADRVANKMLRKHAASLSARALREELEVMLDADTAKLVESAYIKTKSGQRAKVESIDEKIYPTEFDPPEIPQTVTLTEAQAPGTAANPTAFDIRNVGTTLEVDPVISADAKSIDLNIAPEIVRFLGREYTVEDREDLSAYDPETLSSTIYQPKFHAMKHSTAVTVLDGDTVLLGIHRPDDTLEETMMVFLRVDVVR